MNFKCSYGIAAAALAVCGGVQAYDATLIQSDSSETGVSCFTNAASWDPPGIPEAGKTYYAESKNITPPASATAYDENGPATFKGALYQKSGSFYPKDYTWMKGGLHNLNQNYIRFSAATIHFKGDIYCDENPNYMTVCNGTGSQQLYWDDVNLLGSQRFCLVTANTTSNDISTIRWDGDVSQFTATILMLAYARCRADFDFPNAMAFNSGNFTARDGITFRTHVDSTFKQLKLDRTRSNAFQNALDPVDRSTVTVSTLQLSTSQYAADYALPTNGTIRATSLSITGDTTLTARYDGTPESVQHPVEVTSTLTLPTSGKVKVRVSYVTPGLTTAPESVAILRVPKSVKTISVDDFELVASSVTDIPAAFGLPTVTNIAVTVEGDIQTLRIYPRDIVRLTCNYANAGADQAATCWSDGKKPHAGADYYQDGYTVRFSANKFQGDSLSMNHMFQSSCINCDDFRWLSDQCQCYGGIVWDGRATILPNSSMPNMLVYSSNYCNFDVPAEWRGSGDFWFKYRGVASDTRGGTVNLTGLNDNWTGRIKVACQDNCSYDHGVHNITLRIEDARNLGGTRSSFVYNALSVADMNVFSVTNDVTLPASQNAGFLASGHARVHAAANAVLSLEWPVTYNGLLEKEGDGVLAIGAKPRFTDGKETSAPVAGKNRLDVSEGAIQPLATDAFENVAIAFSNNTAICVNPDATGALATYGLVCTASASSVTWPETGSAYVRFRRGAGLSWNDFGLQTVGVITLPTRAAAESALAKLRAQKPARSFATSLDIRENTADSPVTYTVTATLRRSGFSILLR